ncbi:MAG: rhodanese-like domain-containing protein [Deltaproteobacteria bacterium]|nr:rhodanese-like domain-containing protein [Deltaproteobacteria bacterium]
MLLRVGLRLGLLGLGLAGCASSPAPAPASSTAVAAPDPAPTPSVTKEQAHAMVQSGAKLVDVRSPEEYNERHIEGAVNIPVDDLPARASELGNKDQPMVLYCRSGRRADRAAKTLREAGYTKVETLGGIDNW